MMETIRHIIAFIAFAAAVIFGTAGIIGLFRFPDPYSRLQAGALCGTTAVFSIFLGALALAPNWAVATRVLVIAMFFLVSSPTGTHIVARFAWNSGVVPWKPAVPRADSEPKGEASPDRPPARKEKQP